MHKHLPPNIDLGSCIRIYTRPTTWRSVVNEFYSLNVTEDNGPVQYPSTPSSYEYALTLQRPTPSQKRTQDDDKTVNDCLNIPESDSMLDGIRTQAFNRIIALLHAYDNLKLKWWPRFVHFLEEGLTSVTPQVRWIDECNSG